MTDQFDNANPYSSPVAAPTDYRMQTPLRETDYLKAWVLFMICSTVGSAVVGFIAGATTGFALGMAGTSMATLQLICGIVGFLIGLPVQYLFFRLFVSRMLVQKITGHAP